MIDTIVTMKRLSTTEVSSRFYFTVAVKADKTGWVLNVQENHEESWVLATWVKKPSKKEVQFAIDVMIRTLVVLK